MANCPAHFSGCTFSGPGSPVAAAHGVNSNSCNTTTNNTNTNNNYYYALPAAQRSLKNLLLDIQLRGKPTPFEGLPQAPPTAPPTSDCSPP